MKGNNNMDMNTNLQINILIKDILDGVTKELDKYWISLKQEYGLNKGKSTLYIHTPNQLIDLILSEEIPYNLELYKKLFEIRSVSTFTFPIFESTDNNPENDVIAEIMSITLIPMPYLWNLINCCQYNLDDILASMKFRLKREIGTIINCKNNLIGKDVDGYEKFLEDDKESHIKFENSYNIAEITDLEYAIKARDIIPNQKAADEIVGITTQDIIDDFNRINQLNI